jgi:hypothetical protein
LGDNSGADAREFEGGDIGGVFGVLSRGEIAPGVCFEGRNPKMRTTLEPSVPRARVPISEKGWMTELVMVQ